MVSLILSEVVFPTTLMGKDKASFHLILNNEELGFFFNSENMSVKMSALRTL